MSAGEGFVSTCSHDEKKSMVPKGLCWHGTQRLFPVEMQATHFVDLMRYLVGNIDKDTIQALAVGPHQMKLADMAPPPLAEHPVDLPPSIPKIISFVLFKIMCRDTMHPLPW